MLCFAVLCCAALWFHVCVCFYQPLQDLDSAAKGYSIAELGTNSELLL